MVSEATDNFIFFGVDFRTLFGVDFEFNNSQEKMLNLVSDAITHCPESLKGAQASEALWLKDDEQAKSKRLKLYRHFLIEKGRVLITFSAPAELRSLRALGFTRKELRQVKVFDLYVEWRQLKYNNNRFAYGRYFEDGRKRYSIPPTYNKEENKFHNNAEIPNSLSGCVGRMLGVNLDTRHKSKMRELIIDNLDEYSPEQKKAILDYGKSDVKYLFDLVKKFLSVWDEIGHPNYWESALRRGRFMVEIALMEETGIPLDLESTANLSFNHSFATEDIIADLVKEHGPFYRRTPTKKGALHGQWTMDTKYFQKVVGELDPFIQKSWPKSEKTGAFKRDEETLKDWGEGFPALAAFRQVIKTTGQMKSFRPEGYEKIINNIGEDGFLRTFQAPFGSQTGRSQQRPSQGFIPAMSNWYRCLLMAPPGYAIIGEDYSSQEFLIAAILSGDPSMIAAYKSGDPYAYFAMLAGGFSKVDLDWYLEAKSDGGQQDPDDRERFLKIDAIRGLFKSIVLGLQYGMGAAKLAVRLTSDTGVSYSQEEAWDFIQMHKEAFPVYWEWLDDITNRYEDDGKIILHDGWTLLGDNDNFLSVRNFPTQGTGSVIMRESCILAGDNNLNLIYTQHDAVYALAKIEEAKEHAKILRNCLCDGFDNICGGGDIIRVDIDIHKNGHVWVEDKGRKYYELLKKYLEPNSYVVDQEDRFIKSMGLDVSGYVSPLK